MTNFIYVVVGIILLFVLLQVSLRMRSWFRKGKSAPQVDGKLGQQIKKGTPVIAYFYSPSCSACRVQEKNLQQVQEKFKNIMRINAGKEHQTARQFGVMGTPTTVVIENGIIKNYFVGVTPASKLLNTLNV